MNIPSLRKEYRMGGLDRADLDPDPVVQFGRWFDEAARAGLPEPNAMTLATATARGRPSARVVLLKEFGASGFVFYSNYDSRKGGELAVNPWAALVFYWAPLERQVRVEGWVERTSREESAAYFRSRPLGSRLGAAASAQSQPIPGREVLDQRVAELEAGYPGGEVPLPDFWGGYRLVPDAVEFWQGRPNRLHDRFRYSRDQSGQEWAVARLAP
ncbi:MAG TPA: pyridoxamine 5'-phosphate oxidase [Actinomycetes bacterium]|jgi:pyridoxamine 5'-phosphate oxidase|nr:pyridoxamine 5'-phosphate oxidase [Actinomycetes bacterium]